MTYETTEPLITADRRAAGLNCGGKATSLLEISRMVAVPEFIVIPQSWFALAAEAQLAEMAANWGRWDTVHEKSTEATQHLNSVQLTPAMRLVLAAALRDSMPTVTMFAVRSSAVGEDGPQRSFAGL